MPLRSHDHIVGFSNRAPSTSASSGNGRLNFSVNCWCEVLVIHTDTKDCNTLAEILLIVVSEATGFFGATRRIVFGVEVQDNSFACVFRQRDSFAERYL